MNVKAEKQSVKYRNYRQEMFKRDGDQCECGNKEWLRLYHTDKSPEMLYKPSNATTLCRGCASKRYAKDEEFEKPGRGYSSFLVIKVKVLSEVSGRCEETVRRHIRDKKFDPWDLLSIKRWLDKVRKEE
jgi:hypothetical protein